MERWRRGLERSRRRRAVARARRHRARTAAACLLAGAVLLAGGSVSILDRLGRESPGIGGPGASVGAETAEARRPVTGITAPEQLNAARRYARRRDGVVSFAVLDERGLRGLEPHRQYVSASVVKAMLLAAELRRLRAEGRGLDPSTRAVLEAMITVSDNASADSIYYRVGDEGLGRVASAAGMKHFEVSGYWANAQITAADQARFFRALGRNLVGPHAGFARRLLGDIAEYQRWGIHAAVRPRWRVWSKGGWRTTGLGALVHQAAQVDSGRHRFGLAVLTDGQPSQAYGEETIEGIARRLFAADRDGLAD